MSVLVACAGEGERTGGLVRLSAGTTGTLSVETLVPVGGLACVVRHPFLPVAYSVAGRGPGELRTWSTAGPIRLLSSRATDGEEPCHVAVHPSGRALIVSNYASGTLLALPVHENGVPAEGGLALPLHGQGPTRGRQDSAHPHQALFALGGDLVLVPDLGADLLRSFTFDPDTASLTPAGSAALPPGTGPRHAVTLDTGLVVITGELSQTVVAGRLGGSTGGAGRWNAVPSTSRNPTTPNYPGDVLAHPDAPVVYVANRGADTLAVFRVEGDEVLFVQEVAAGVRWPQHLAFVDDEVLVAGRDSSLVVALQVRPDGRLGTLRPLARLPGPMWLAPEQKRGTTRVAPSRR